MAYLKAIKDLAEVNNLAHLFSTGTELAAIVAARTAGFGDKKASDRAAVTALRDYFNSLPIDAVIEVGEGEKDKAPMLHVGEVVGKKTGPKLSIAVDPLEGTDATAALGERASSVIAVSERGGLFRLPKGVYYMDKLVVSPEAKGKVDINAPVKHNLSALAKTLDRNISDLTVVVLERPRNQKLIDEIRAAGARVRSIQYGDLYPGVQTCAGGSSVHAVMGIGGAPEAILTAAGIRNLGGELQAKIRPKDEENARFLKSSGVDLEKVYTEHDLVTGKFIVFSATAVTSNGKALEGVRFFKNGARTNTISIAAIDGKVKVTKNDSVIVTDNSTFHYRLD